MFHVMRGLASRKYQISWPTKSKPLAIHCFQHSLLQPVGNLIRSRTRSNFIKEALRIRTCLCLQCKKLPVKIVKELVRKDGTHALSLPETQLIKGIQIENNVSLINKMDHLVHIILQYYVLKKFFFPVSDKCTEDNFAWNMVIKS
jgi:hypothetical protein